MIWRGVGASDETSLDCANRSVYYIAEDEERITIEASNCYMLVYGQPLRIRLMGNDNTLYTYPGVSVDDQGSGNMIVQTLDE